MYNNKIIINGYGGSGKDEFADYLVENYGYKKLFFAEGIYEIAYKYFGMTTKDRKLLQSIGQKMREINPDIWVRYTMEQATKYDKVVISDCRQENEYLWAVEDGFTPIRIEADLDKRIERIERRDSIKLSKEDLELLENESETGADNFPYTTIDNNSTIEDFHKRIDCLLKLKESEVR